MYVWSVLKYNVHIYIGFEMLVLRNKYLSTSFKFIFGMKCHICIVWAEFYIAEKGNRIYWYSQNHINMKHNKCNQHGCHLSSWSEMQFNVKSVTVTTGIMLIHKRMSDTTLNLFYGSNIQMFSHYRCFIVKMEGLYMQYPSTGRAQHLEGNFPLHKVNCSRTFNAYTLSSPPIFFISFF
jgi:hypothetical protein